MEVAELILVRHIRPVCEIARLGEDHRLPFARRAVEKLCGVAEWSIQRIITILERIGFFTDRSPLARWCEGNARSITPGSKPYWFRPTLFSIGAAFAAILLGGTEVAASPLENHCTPDVIPSVEGRELDDRTAQPIRGVEENQHSPIRSTSIPSTPHGFDEPPVDEGLEAALERLRQEIASQAMPDDRRAPQASPADLQADLEAKKGRGLIGTTLSEAATAIFRRRW